MFEAAEVGHALSKEDFDAREPSLREELLDAQLDLLEQAKFSVVVVVGGVDASGKGDAINLLNEWLDPRHVTTHALAEPTGDDRERPPFYRFWRALPPRGKIGVFIGSWYTRPIVDRVYGRIRRAELDRAMRQAVLFERMLSNEGVLVLKFWLHLSKKTQRRRLEELEKSDKTRWRVTPTDWDHHRRYDRFRRVSERALRESSSTESPWIVVEATDARYRDLTIATAIAHGIRRRLEVAAPTRHIHAPELPPPIDGRRILGTIDLDRAVPQDEYKDQLPRLQGRLNLLFREPAMKKRGVVLVFEGVDAAGKGGAIRRVTQALDARQYRVIPIAAPTDEEKGRPYLWRFWRNLPGHGQMTIYDRSWYGRVLVERIEGFCDTDDWMRAYGEINEFEEQVAESGVVVVKFWLQISAEEQLARFEARATTGFKRHKITPDDWRNREKWDAYQQAASEMIERTSTEYAPWTIVEANDKYHARIRVLETVAARLERVVDG
jgi:polyphosphate:AMP phosphotransferase